MISGASNLANTVDSVFLLISSICVGLLVIVTSVMVYFVIRYNRKKNLTPSDIESNTPLEIIWTVIPTILVLAMFYYGFIGFKIIRKVPKDAMVIKVTGHMWAWQFEYENGKQSNILNLPEEKPVKLELSSWDVIHSLYIPAFRVKEDAVPGKKNYLWFEPTKVGTYNIFCAEYCGQGHSSMLARAVVMPENDFNEWMGSKSSNTKNQIANKTRITKSK